MKTVNMPGFTAETSLQKTSEHYQSVATQSYSSGEQGIISQQLRTGGFGSYGAGGFGFWGCGTLCAAAYALCLAGCTGLSGPAAPACYAICSGLYTGCKDGCNVHTAIF